MFLRTYMLLSKVIIWRHLGTDWTIRLTLKTDIQDHSNSPVCHVSDKNVKPRLCPSCYGSAFTMEQVTPKNNSMIILRVF